MFVQKNATSASSRLISALSAVAVAAALTTSPMFPTTASEFNIRIQNQPEGYVLDDARLLSQDTQKDVAKKLAELEEETGAWQPVEHVRSWHGVCQSLPVSRAPYPRNSCLRRLCQTSYDPSAGYKVIVITLSKLEYDPSAGAFAEKMVVKWYPTLRQVGRRRVQRCAKMGVRT